MKFIIFNVLLVLLFTSCKNDKKKISATYSLIKFSHGKIDTLEIEKPIFHNSKEDSLISSTYFFYNNKNHFIRMYSNEKTCAIDAEHILYELDSIGVIYSQSTAWNSYSRLYCNNETKKQLIDIALDNIIGSIKLKREYIQTLYNSKIEFIEPK